MNNIDIRTISKNHPMYVHVYVLVYSTADSFGKIFLKNVKFQDHRRRRMNETCPQSSPALKSGAIILIHVFSL